MATLLILYSPFATWNIQIEATEKLSQANTAYDKELHRLQKDLTQSRKDTKEAQDDRRKLQDEVRHLQDALDVATSTKVKF